MTVDADNAGAGMWAEHLNSLRRLAQHRFVRSGRETHPYVIWSICVLDIHASLMGNGNCDFFRTVVEQNMLPPLGSGMPTSGPTSSASVWPNEARTLPAILTLNRGVMTLSAKLAQTAQAFRTEASARTTPVSPGSYARWQAAVSQLQTQLFNFWAEAYPEFLERESPQAARDLAPRVRSVFQHVSLRPSTALIWRSTNMLM